MEQTDSHCRIWPVEIRRQRSSYPSLSQAACPHCPQTPGCYPAQRSQGLARRSPCLQQSRADSTPGEGTVCNVLRSMGGGGRGGGHLYCMLFLSHLSISSKTRQKWQMQCRITGRNPNPIRFVKNEINRFFKKRSALSSILFVTD